MIIEIVIGCALLCWIGYGLYKWRLYKKAQSYYRKQLNAAAERMRAQIAMVNDHEHRRRQSTKYQSDQFFEPWE
jgi:hypothetical protein